jgi:orotate phosphoribosyltransferase
MLTFDQARTELAALLRRKSIFHGDFTLASGAKSNYYIDCRLTTLDGRGAWLVGQLVHATIRREEAARKIKIAALGGLTMGADPLALSTAMHSSLLNDPTPLRAFLVRKTPKGHGQGKQVDGNFNQGDTVVVVDDVITRGDSTLTAVEAVVREGGQVAFIIALVDRQEGGRAKIEARGYPVVPIFTRDELLSERPQSQPSVAGVG